MLFLATFLYAENSITLNTSNAHPGDEVSVSISMSNTDAVSALEIAIPLDKNLSYVENTCTLATNRVDGHQVEARVVNDILKIYIYSLSLKNLKGSDGKLLSFTLKMQDEPGTYTLTPSVLLSDASGKSLSCKMSNSQITILSPKIEIVTSSIDFGHVPIRATYTKELTIKNVGNEDLQVSNVVFDNAILSVTEKEFVVAVGASKNVTVTFAPTERGAFSANAFVYSNAINNTVFKKQQSAAIIADPFSVNELHVQPSSGISDDIATIVLTMNNMEPIVAAQCSFVLPTALQYVEGSAKVINRGVGHSVSASYEKNTLKIFAYSSTNTAFSDNDGEFLSFDVLLNGNSGQYRISPSDVILSNATMENMVSATYDNYVTIQSPTISGANQLSFGSQPITTDVTATYTVRNTGKATLVVDKISFLSDGYTVVTPLPIIVNRGESREFVVKYNPLAEGAFSTIMQVYSNDPTCRMKSVDLSGNIFEPNVLSTKGKRQANGNYVMSVALENYSQIAAIQFDIKNLPNTLLQMKDVVASNRLKNHQYLVTQMDESSYRVLIYNLTNDIISGNEGELLKMTFVSDVTTETTITIENVILSDKNGVNKESTGNITLQAKYGFESEPHAITVEPTEHGTITISNTSEIVDEIVFLESKADEGYMLDEVYVNGAKISDITQFVMPDTDVTINAVFAKVYKIVVESQGGTVVTSDTIAKQGTIVTLTALAQLGSAFESWESEDVSVSGDGTFVMPDKDVLVKANFKHVHELMYVREKQATCTEDGHNGYYVCKYDYCKQMFRDKEGTIPTDQESEKIPMLGHDWLKVSYTWSSDFSLCVATRICKRDGEHIENAQASISTEIIKEATEEEEGEMRYSASFAEDWAENQYQYFVISKKQTSVGELENSVEVYSCNKTIFVKGAESENVKVYTLGGALVYSAADVPMVLQINVGHVGPYVIQVGNRNAYKVVLR